MDLLVIIVLLVLAACCAGLLAGLFGVGGGIVVVPALYFLLQSFSVSVSSAMLMATATSLLVMISTSFSSSWAHWRRGNVDLNLVKIWAPPLVFGSVLSATLATRVGGVAAVMVFAAVIVLAALNMLCRSVEAAVLPELPRKVWQASIAFIIGLLSTLMGIGGGTLTVPVLTSFSFSAYKAIGSASVFGLLIALPSGLIHLLVSATPPDAPRFTVGLVYLPVLLVVVPVAALVAPLGVKLGGQFSAQALQKSFAVFLLCVALLMVGRVWAG